MKCWRTISKPFLYIYIYIFLHSSCFSVCSDVVWNNYVNFNLRFELAVWRSQLDYLGSLSRIERFLLVVGGTEKRVWLPYTYLLFENKLWAGAGIEIWTHYLPAYWLLYHLVQ